MSDIKLYVFDFHNTISLNPKEIRKWKTKILNGADRKDFNYYTGLLKLQDKPKATDLIPCIQELVDLTELKKGETCILV
jgi:hypothetical protein